MKNIHKKVIEVKNNPKVEVEFMTLLERDREKIEEGIEKGIEKGRKEGKLEEKLEIARNLLDILDDETISKKTGLGIEEVRKLRRAI